MVFSRPRSRVNGEPQHADRLETSAWPVRSSQVVSEAPRIGYEHLGALYAVIDWSRADERGLAAAGLAATTLVQRYYGGNTDARTNLYAALDEAQGAAQRLASPSAAPIRMLAIVVVGTRAFAHGSAGFEARLVQQGKSLPFAGGQAHFEDGSTVFAQIGRLATEPHMGPGEDVQAMTRRLGAASDGATILAVGFGSASAAHSVRGAGGSTLPTWWPAALGVFVALALASAVVNGREPFNERDPTPASRQAAPLSTAPSVAQTGTGGAQGGSNTTLQVVIAPSATFAATNTVAPSPIRVPATAVPAPTQTRPPNATPVQAATSQLVTPTVGELAPVDATPSAQSATSVVPSPPTQIPGTPDPAASATVVGVPIESPALATSPASSSGEAEVIATPTEPRAEATPAVLITTTPVVTSVQATPTATNMPAVLPRQPVGRSAPVAVPIGGEIEFVVEGFGPHERLSVWATPLGRLSEALPEAKADVNGTARWTWRVPPTVVTGQWNMVAANKDGIQAVIHFEVIAIPES